MASEPERSSSASSRASPAASPVIWKLLLKMPRMVASLMTSSSVTSRVTLRPLTSLVSRRFSISTTAMRLFTFARVVFSMLSPARALLDGLGDPGLVHAVARRRDVLLGGGVLALADLRRGHDGGHGRAARQALGGDRESRQRLIERCARLIAVRLRRQHHAHRVRLVAPHRDRARVLRSEEHTSELQSRFDLVCRLLLEKKKNK